VAQGRAAGLLTDGELPVAAARYHGTPTSTPCLSHPAPWLSLRRSFLQNGGAHSASRADRSPVDTTQLLSAAYLPSGVCSFTSADGVPEQHHVPVPFFQ